MDDQGHSHRESGCLHFMLSPSLTSVCARTRARLLSSSGWFALCSRLASLSLFYPVRVSLFVFVHLCASLSVPFPVPSLSVSPSLSPLSLTTAIYWAPLYPHPLCSGWGYSGETRSTI